MEAVQDCAVTEHRGITSGYSWLTFAITSVCTLGSGECDRCDADREALVQKLVGHHEPVGDRGV